MRLVPLFDVSFVSIAEKGAYVVVGLVGTVLGETKVVGLLGGHGGELDAELTEMGSGNLLVEGLGEHAEWCQLVAGMKRQLAY
jgi:hypothetical protein